MPKPCPDSKNCPLFRGDEPCRPDEIDRCVEWAKSMICGEVVDVLTGETVELLQKRKQFKSSIADNFDKWRGFSTS